MPKYKVKDAHAECAGDAGHFPRATRKLQRICSGDVGEKILVNFIIMYASPLFHAVIAYVCTATCLPLTVT